MSIKYLVHVSFTIEMLVFILQLKNFPKKLCKFKLSAALKSSKVFLNVPKTCFSGVDDFLIDNYDLTLFLSFTAFCKISTVQSKPLNF